jgi:hypothetical protein
MDEQAARWFRVELPPLLQKSREGVQFQSSSNLQAEKSVNSKQKKKKKQDLRGTKGISFYFSTAR